MTKDRSLLLVVILIACASFGLLYFDHFPKLIALWNLDDFSYCYLVPLIFVYLVWDKLDLNINPSPFLGMVAFLLFFFIYYVGLMAAMGSFVYFSMWGFILASFISIYGVHFVIANKFSLTILLFIVPIPSFLTTVITFRLRLVSSWISEMLIKASGISVYREGNTLDLGTAALQVVDACSGLRYLMPSILLAMLVGYFFLHSRFKRVLLVVLSIPISVFSNSIRIYIVALVSKYISVDVATGLFHDFAGLLIFLTTIILVVICVLIFRVNDEPSKSVSPAIPTTRGLTMKEFALWGGVCLMSVYLSFYETHVVDYDPMEQSLSTFSIESDSEKRLSLSAAEEAVLQPDEYFMATYKLDGAPYYLLITKYLSQSMGRLAHYPVTCLVGSGWNVEKTSTVFVQYKGVTLPFRQTLLNRGEALLISRIMYVQRSRLLTNPLLYKYYLLYDGIVHERTDGVLIRFDMSIPGNVGMAEANRMADVFSVKIISELEEKYKESPFL